MPTYRITAPDGHTYQITAPEGATEAEVLAYAQRHGSSAKTVAEQTQERQQEANAAGQREILDDMGPVDRVMVGAGRGMTDVAQGVKQAGLQLGEFYDQLPMALKLTNPGLALNARAARQSGETAADYTRKATEELGDYAPLAEDSPVLSGAGRIAGNIAAMPIPVGRAATVGGRIAQGARAGAVSGAVQFVPEGGSRVENASIGAVVGAALPGVLQAGKVTIGAVRDVAGKLKEALPNMTTAARERTVAKILREAAADPNSLNRLSQPSQLVAGTQQTLAEATDDRGLAALQNTLSNVSADFKTQLGELAERNNTARVEAIRGAFGGADEASAVAIEQARNKATQPLLRTAQQVTGVNVRPVVLLADRIVKGRDGRPAVQAAVQKVRDLLVRDVTPEDRGRNALQALMGAKGKRMSHADFNAMNEAATLARRVAAGTISPDEAAAALKALKPTSVVAQRAIKSGRDLLSSQTRNVDDIHRLYNARQSIGDMLSGSAGADSDAARAASRELLSVRGALDNQMRKASPEFADYLVKFRDMSREAGQVRMGAELLGKSRPTLDKMGNPILSPAQFARAGNDLDRVAAQATGFRKQTAERLMTPTQKNTVGAIRADLDRVTRVNDAGTALGSNTAQNLERIGALRSAATGVEDDVRSAALSSMPVVGKVIDHLNQRYGKQVVALLQEVVFDPPKAQALLARIPAAQRQQVTAALQNPQIRQALEVLRIAGPRAAAAGAVSADPQQ